MSGPGLIFWIIGFPFVLAVVELVRTFSAIRATPRSGSGRGDWSRALNVNA